MTEDDIEKIVVKISGDGIDGTGFLISSNKVLTAYHVIKNNVDIIVRNSPTNRCFAKVLNSEAMEMFKDTDVVLLELEKEFEIPASIIFKDFDKIPKSTNWQSRGASPTPGEFTINIGLSPEAIVNQHSELSSTIEKNNDIHLNVNCQYDSYRGFSGAPIVIDNAIVGILTDEINQSGTARGLKGVSVKHFKQLLIDNGIKVETIKTPNNQSQNTLPLYAKFISDDVGKSLSTFVYLPTHFGLDRTSYLAFVEGVNAVELLNKLNEFEQIFDSTTSNDESFDSRKWVLIEFCQNLEETLKVLHNTKCKHTAVVISFEDAIQLDLHEGGLNDIAQKLLGFYDKNYQIILCTSFTDKLKIEPNFVKALRKKLTNLKGYPNNNVLIDCYSIIDNLARLAFVEEDYRQAKAKNLINDDKITKKMQPYLEGEHNGCKPVDCKKHSMALFNLLLRAPVKATEYIKQMAKSSDVNNQKVSLLVTSGYPYLTAQWLAAYTEKHEKDESVFWQSFDRIPADKLKAHYIIGFGFCYWRLNSRIQDISRIDSAFEQWLRPKDVQGLSANSNLSSAKAHIEALFKLCVKRMDECSEAIYEDIEELQWLNQPLTDELALLLESLAAIGLFRISDHKFVAGMAENLSYFSWLVLTVDIDQNWVSNLVKLDEFYRAIFGLLKNDEKKYFVTKRAEDFINRRRGRNLLIGGKIIFNRVSCEL